MANSIENVVVIVPSYKPDDNLINTVKSIKDKGFKHFIVVDDGGGETYSIYFDAVKSIEGCTVLHHEANQGKGAALKTAFKYFTENMSDMAGVVTVDSDGQHLPDDVYSVSEKMLENGNVVLGCRDFSLPEVPGRSKFGNNTTSVILKLFFGMKVSDTQTGLRAIPTKYIETLASAKGKRYEYETQMLFMMKSAGIKHDEVTIKTIYLDNNSASHFRPIRDSIRIYSLIIKYLLSSLSSFLVDVIIYYILLKLLPLDSVVLGVVAAVTARIISSVFNFTLNAKTVFDGEINKSTVIKYFTLAAIIISCSMLSVELLKRLLSVEYPIIQTVIKAIVDTVLFLLSFRFQSNWVFKKKIINSDGGNNGRT